MIDRDTAIALAKQAGALRFSHPYRDEESDSWAASTDNIERFARLIEQRAAETEREKLDDAMDSFWTMLKECETNADNNDDRVLKHWVEAWHSQYARIMGREIKEPRWIERARGTGGEG
jgi:hypothetical protein